MQTTRAQNICRILLGLMLLFTGTGHLTFLRTEFLAQVPKWVPMDADLVVVLSGIVELLIGISLIFLTKFKTYIGWIAAAFFIAIFPGNIAQLINHRDAFGMHSDTARWIRLLFQPVLVFVAVWSTGAWQSFTSKKELKKATN